LLYHSNQQKRIPCFIHTVLTLRDEKYRVQIPKGVGEFLFFTTVQPGPMAHPTSYSMGTAVLSRG